MEESPQEIIGSNDPWDPLMDVGDLSGHWTITNLGEAAPGVITPLAATLWNRPADSVARRSAYAIGAMTRAERDSDSEEIRVIRLYYGHAAARLEYMARLGDRMPGTTGEEAIVSLFGKAPPGMTFSPTRRRYPIIAARLPMAYALAPRRIRAVAAEHDRWWRAAVDGAGELDRAAAVAQFADAVQRFEDSMTTHVIGLLSSVQPLFDALSRLVERVGIGDVALLSGSGGAEMAVVGDIWKASRGQLDVDEVARIHGFHGPAEGELSSRVWREDSSPLRGVVEQYAQRPDSDDPLERERRRLAESEKVRQQILAAVPRGRRSGARLLLGLARERIPLRGVGKRSFLQAIDVARASARRVGEHLAAEGVLDDPEDVFYLTGDELIRGVPADARELVALRRERRAAYQDLSFVAAEWSGMPEVVSSEDLEAPGDDVVTGTGVSAGVVEGTVRVVTNPDFADVEPDEVLVAPFTDPSWSSIMFVSSALVVDIGGALSHAAVVARELGIPCVVNTRTGTKALRTGDRVRVDGEAGTVEILERAA